MTKTNQVQYRQNSTLQSAPGWDNLLVGTQHFHIAQGSSVAMVVR